MSAELGLNIMAQERTFPFVISATATVRDLKNELVASGELQQTSTSETGSARTRVHVLPFNIRLIAAGRVLADDSAKLTDLGLVDGSFVHVALRDLHRAASAQNVAAGAAGRSSSGADVEQPIDGQAGPGRPHPFGGFDRLRLIGLSEEEVSVLRAQFLPEVQRLMPNYPLLPYETEARRLQRCEEIWMRQQGDDSDFAMNLRPLMMAARANGLAGGSSSSGRLGAFPPAGLYPGLGINRPGGPDYHEEALLRAGAEAEGDAHGNGAGASVEGTPSQFYLGMVLGWVLGPFTLIIAFSPQATRKLKLGICTGVGVSIFTAIALSLMDPNAGASASAGSSGGAGKGSGEVAIPSFGPIGTGSAWTGANTGLTPVDIDTLGSRLR